MIKHLKPYKRLAVICFLLILMVTIYRLNLLDFLNYPFFRFLFQIIMLPILLLATFFDSIAYNLIHSKASFYSTDISPYFLYLSVFLYALAIHVILNLILKTSHKR